MLKYKTSALTEAMDNFFDKGLLEADPAVTVIPSGDSETKANKSTLEQFISTVFSDHSEDISNVNIDYNGNEVEILVDVNDESKIGSLVSLYNSKFDLEGKENNAWSNVTVDRVKALDYPCFVIKLTLGGMDEEVLYTYSLDDLYQITEGHDDARVVLEDIESNVRVDDLLDLINSKNFRTDDEVLDFLLSDEVDNLRNEDNEFESENLTEDIGSTRREVPIKLGRVDNDITNTADMIGKYVKIRGNYHEIVDVKDEGKGLYTVSFSASTDGKTPGGEFEQGTADQLSKLQLYQELKENENYDNKIDSTKGISESEEDNLDIAFEAIDEFLDKYGIDYYEDEDGGYPLIVLSDTNRTLIYIDYDEFDGMNSNEVKKYITDKLIQGFNDYREDLGDKDYIDGLDDSEISKGEEIINRVLNNSIEESCSSDADISDAAWDAVDKLGDNYDYTQDGQGSDYTNTFYKDGSIVAEIDDSELQGMNKQQMTSYIVNKIKRISENENLTEQVVPASELGFKHQELAKIEDEVALISKLKGEDPGNELYTDLLGCFDKAIEILKDAINEDPVGTVVGKDDVAVEFDGDASLGDSSEESVSDIDSSDIPEEDPNLEEPSEDEEEM